MGGAQEVGERHGPGGVERGAAPVLVLGEQDQVLGREFHDGGVDQVAEGQEALAHRDHLRQALSQVLSLRAEGRVRQEVGQGHGHVVGDEPVLGAGHVQVAVLHRLREALGRGCGLPELGEPDRDLGG